MIPLLLLLVQAGQAPITISATVDRSPVPVGEELVYSLRAVTTETGPVRAELPEMAGLDEIERTERIDPVPGMPGARSYVLDVRLRAARVGTWRLGPVLVFVGGAVEAAPEVAVTVVASAGATNAVTNPRLLSLIQRAPPPRASGTATVAVVTSSRRVVRGEQLDVLTIAWFPRSVRVRLRRPPTLKPPVLSGVWSVPQPALPGVVASQPAGGEVYDLFVSHQIVFPLAAGELAIPPARVDYAVPTSQRATSAERPIEVVSDTTVVQVGDPASAGRPAGFAGPVGQDMKVAYRLRSLPARAGEVLPVDLAVAGRGNVQFWPSPVIDWPAGTRAYLDGIDESSRAEGGLLGGVRTFRFLLLPDSLGSIVLPAIRYPYYDPAGGTYREATAGGLVIPVTEGSPSASRDAVALAPSRADWASRVDALRPATARWWLLLLSVPVLLLAIAWRRGRAAPAAAPRAGSPLEQLERSFMVLAPDSGDLPPADVAASLRRAGIETELATELVALRRNVDRARFGPEAERAPGRDTGENGQARLADAAAGLLSRLPRELRRRVGLAAMLLAVPVAARAQGPAELYANGAFGAAAEAFRAQAIAQPERWQLWYDLAAAEHALGRDAAAAAALATALQLAPRAPLARDLWQQLERIHEPLRAARPRVPLSRGELGLLIVATVWLGAGLMVWGARRRWVRSLAIGLPAIAVALALAADRPDLERAGFLRGAVPVRLSPHGLAAERGRLPGLALVGIEARRGDWLLVRDRGGVRGWVPRGAVATRPGVD